MPKRLHILCSFLISALNKESACASVISQFLVGKNLVAVPHMRQMVSVPASRFLDTGHRLIEQPGIRRGNPGLGKQPGNKGKGRKPKDKQFVSHKAVLS